MLARCLHIGLVVIFGLILVSVGVFTPRRTAAQADARCFAETGQCISGAIRVYWETNGGLPVFGYPITEQRVEEVEGRTLAVQWFERDRLEIQGDGRVTAGRLGARLLELEGRPWETFEQVSSAPPGCVFFAETRHSLCPENFLGYWRDNGGLERFGYPITEPFEEVIEGRRLLVQYFERRRMELHMEMPGRPVLLGLLGRIVRELLNSPPPPVASTPPQCVYDTLNGGTESERLLRRAYERVTFRSELGCPLFALEREAEASSQQLERGEMLWAKLRAIPRSRGEFRFIFAVINPGPEFRRYDDTWQEGADLDRPALTPPREGLYAPWRGFGKVWANDAVLRDRIGWALEEQAQPRTATFLMLPTSSSAPADVAFLLLIEETRMVYAFGNPANPAHVEVIAP